ncbi:hypothetical protein [Peristeroidobacter soli]|jgi:hypothetical protein|uniref:hypothetical protein n=1 Tax=Peristeroidobacter soli TaxID=2497877 RepID=UPI00101B9FD2|nr:hypothetical protein [Peristeroidobacter soli]
MKKKSAPAQAEKKGKKKNVGELQRRALDARKRAESARKEARDAKDRAREARKLFKEAKKVAKKARAELEGLSKKLKKLLGPDATLKAKPKQRSA